MNLKIENSLTGPLARPRTRKALESAVDKATSLDEARMLIHKIVGLTTHKGGSHIAVHQSLNGKFQYGSRRLAIVTE